MQKKANGPKILTLAIALAIIAIAVSVVMIIRGVLYSGGGSYIGVEEAKNIAVSKAGVMVEDITFTKSALETENEIAVYKVKFYTDEDEYDYEIDPENGSIISEDKDPVRKKERKSARSKSSDPAEEATKKCKDASKYIGVRKAEKIALSDAGIKRSDAYFEIASLSHDDGYPIYEIEFRSGGAKYKYEINAVSGGVLEKSTESKRDVDGDE